VYDDTPCDATAYDAASRHQGASISISTYSAIRLASEANRRLAPRLEPVDADLRGEFRVLLVEPREPPRASPWSASTWRGRSHVIEDHLRRKSKRFLIIQRSRIDEANMDNIDLSPITNTM
jgi:hypothetical protein